MKQIRRDTFRSSKRRFRSSLTPSDQPEAVVWTKSADEILASIARFAQQTVNATGRTIKVANHGYRTRIKRYGASRRVLTQVAGSQFRTSNLH
jgi:hypothetical protein